MTNNEFLEAWLRQFSRGMAVTHTPKQSIETIERVINNRMDKGLTIVFEDKERTYKRADIEAFGGMAKVHSVLKDALYL